MHTKSVLKILHKINSNRSIGLDICAVGKEPLRIVLIGPYLLFVIYRQRFHFTVSCKIFKVRFVIVVVIHKTDENKVIMFEMLTVVMYSIRNRSHASGFYWVDLNHEIKESSLFLLTRLYSFRDVFICVVVCGDMQVYINLQGIDDLMKEFKTV
jgi:hypothetical protein